MTTSTPDRFTVKHTKTAYLVLDSDGVELDRYPFDACDFEARRRAYREALDDAAVREEALLAHEARVIAAQAERELPEPTDEELAARGVRRPLPGEPTFPLKLTGRAVVRVTDVPRPDNDPEPTPPDPSAPRCLWRFAGSADALREYIAASHVERAA